MLLRMPKGIKTKRARAKNTTHDWTLHSPAPTSPPMSMMGSHSMKEPSLHVLTSPKTSIHFAPALGTPMLLAIFVTEILISVHTLVSPDVSTIPMKYTRVIAKSSCLPNIFDQKVSIIR